MMSLHSLKSYVLLFALLFVLAALSPAPSLGQPTGAPYLVRDLAPESSVVDRQTNPSDGLEVDGRLLVAWSGQGYGVLWSTDGTAAGTRSVLDVRSTLGAVAATDSFALFDEPRFGDDDLPPLGSRLWSSDGTAAGTRSLVSVDGRVGEGHALGEQVIFSVFGGPEEGLWATDGTDAGTRQLAAADAALFQVDTGVVLSSGRLVFIDERSGDRRLWSTDGTPEGTFPIEATGEGAAFENILWLRSATDGDEVLFSAETAATGDELFATDGTRAGTRLVAEIVPGPGGAPVLRGPVYEPQSDLFYLFALTSFTPDDDIGLYQVSLDGEVQRVATSESQSRTELALAVHEGRVLYGLDGGELWAIPGPDAAPVLLADTVSGTRGSVQQIVTGIDEVAYAIIESGPDLDRSLWVTDGTPATTRFYGDPCPAPCRLERFFELFAGGFAFATSQAGRTSDLYRLDPSGLVRLTDFGPGREGVSQFLGLVDDRAIVRAYTLDDESRRRPQTLTSDGTAAGTFTLPPTPRRDIEPSSIAEMVAFGGLAAFTEDRFLISLYPYPRPAGDRLWLSDGTEAGTRVVDTASSVGTLRGTGYFDLQAQGDRLVYLGIAPGADGEPTWEVRSTRADGTSRSLLLVDQAVPEPRLPRGEQTIGLARSAGRVYLRTEAGFRILVPGADDFGPLVPVRWFTDHVVDPTPEDDNDDSRPVRLGGDDLFLTGPFTDEADSWALWTTDGTAAGSRSLAAGNGGAHDLVRVGERVYFVVDDSGIWSSDGTVAGTGPLADPLPGASGASEVAEIHQLHGAGGILYAETERADGTPDLWAIEEPAGIADADARRVLDARHVLGGEEDASGRLAFVAAEPLGAAARAARSDGTLAGTVVFDAGPRVLEPRPETLEVVGDRLFLAGFDVPHGIEPWRVDLDSGQSRRLGGVFPGIGSSAPAHLTAVGDLLFFEAGAPEVGRELFAVPISASGGGGGGGGGGQIPPRPNTEPLTSPNVPGFRFWVEITPQGQAPLVGSAEGACIPETLCVSGALAGRTEVFLRVIGPRPNGLLWPVITRFTPSRVEVWIEQASTGDLRYYDLPATDPEGGELTGLIDREGFVP